MSALTKTNTEPLGSIFESFTPAQIDLIKQTVCKGATDNELQLFLYTCKHAGVDPLLKQIYAVKRKGVMTIQLSIDGLRTIAERTGRYAPGAEPKYTYNSNNELLSATAYVNKMTPDGTWHTVAATAYFKEYVQSFLDEKKRPYVSKFWQKMPHIMLAKCAESNALRKAFPFELGGLYSSEEMANGMNKKPDEDEFLTAEVVGISPEDEVEIEIPEEVDKDKVTLYLEFLSTHYEQPIPVMKKWVNEKPETFWKAFHKWNAKLQIEEEE